MFRSNNFSSSYTSYFPRYVTAKIPADQGNLFYDNKNYGASNSLLIRSAFYRYLKKRRILLVLLLCVILISLSYLFTVSGGLQFKKHKIGKELLSVPRFPYDEILNTEEISVQYSKLTRLNKSIQKVISYGKISLLNEADSLENNFLNSDKDVNSDIKKFSTNGHPTRLGSTQLINNTKDYNILLKRQKHHIDVKNNVKSNKLNYEDEQNHSNQMTELTGIWKQSKQQNDVGLRRQRMNSFPEKNIMDLSHLKQDLNNPEFQKRLTSMKNRQQEYVINILRQRKQLIELPDGGSIIISAPNMNSFTIPIGLKRKPVELWSQSEKIWLNITYYPWLNDTKCENFTTVFSNNQPLPSIALASNPNSGNTWLRYLIEGITGIFTGSFYGDIDLSRKGYYGESLPYDSGLTSVIKAHGSTTNEGTTSDQMMWTNGNAILLIRNPYNAIYGHRHLDAGGHVGYADASHFFGPGWDHFVSNKIQMWEQFYLKWLEEGNDVMIVVFEHLTKGLLNETLKEIFTFLNFAFDEERLKCTIKHSEGRFHRKEKCIRKRLPVRKKNVAKENNIYSGSNQNNTNDIFTEQQKLKINLAIQNVNDAIIKRSLNPLPLSNYKNTVIRLNVCP